MIRSKGEAGTGNIVEAVRHLREIVAGIKRLTAAPPEELAGDAKEHQAPLEVVPRGRRARAGCPFRCSAPVASRRPADAAMTMRLGAGATPSAPGS